MDEFYRRNTAWYNTLVGRFRPGIRFQAGSSAAKVPAVGTVVSARIRPLLDEDIAAGFPCAIFPRSAQAGVVDIHDLYNHPRGRPVLKSFDYQVDQLFTQEATTDEIYESLVQDLVSFAQAGGIGTLFTYGQTGSGKTFTVTGIQRLVAESLMGGNDEGRRQIGLTIIDLAGNSAYDLLNDRQSVSILEDAAGAPQLRGSTEERVKSKDEMLQLFEKATSARLTASTTKNDASSRSHAICRVRITDTTTGSDGLLFLVDLAGSEAARDVASHGADRMRETREINLSLSVLKDCIRGKAESNLIVTSGESGSKQKNIYIPTRRSALTRVLKHVFDPSEGRSCRTVIIACLNPSLADAGPSKNTLRYAELLRARQPPDERLEANLMGGHRSVRA